MARESERQVPVLKYTKAEIEEKVKELEEILTRGEVPINRQWQQVNTYRQMLLKSLRPSEAAD